MEFWFIEYDKESFDRNFLKVDYLKYLNQAISVLPLEELNTSIELSENRIERLLQEQLLEQHNLLVSYFNELNSQTDDKKYHFKDFIRITSLFLQLEKLYFQQYWEFDLLKDFILNRLFASFLRFFKFFLCFHNSICDIKLRILKTSEFEENKQIDKIFSNSLIELAKRNELFIKMDDLLPFQQYFQISLETLAKSLDRSVSTLSKEKLFINQMSFIFKNFLYQDLHFLLQDCKSRFADCESFLISKILQDNDSNLVAINKIQQELENTDRKKTFHLAEKELATVDAHYIDNVLENLLEQYNPTNTKFLPAEQDNSFGEKVFSRKGTGSGSGGGNQRDSSFDQNNSGSQKKLGSGSNSKLRKTFKANDFENSRKTLMNQEDNYKKAKNSSYSLNLFQNSLNSQKKNSRNENSLKVKTFVAQRTNSNVNNREKSDSMSELPKKIIAYNPNTTKLGAKFDKDTLGDYHSLQPQIDYQKNMNSALESNRYKDSPNFVRNDYENPLLRYIDLSSVQKEENSVDFLLDSKISNSIYASFGLLDGKNNAIPNKNSNKIVKTEFFSQMNEKLNENLLSYLMTETNLADIKPEEIRFEKNEEKLEEKDVKKKGKGKKIEEDKQILHPKNLTNEEKELAIEEEKKRKDNFFIRTKNQKKGEQQKVKKIDEKDFIKIDENTEILGKLEYMDIDEHSAEDIKDCELFDLNYKSEEENLKNNNWLNENDDKTFIGLFAKLEREEFLNFVKIFTPNNTKQWWKKLRNSLSSDANYNMVSKILNDKKIPEIKRRDFDFKRKHKVIVSNLFGQNCFL